MITVHRTGTVVRIPLQSELGKPAEEQTALLVKVLDFDEYRRTVGAAGRISSDFEHSLERLRKILGQSLVGVENLKVADQASGETKDFVLERAGSEITKASMAILAPWANEILDAIIGAHTFGITEAKNSQ